MWIAVDKLDEISNQSCSPPTTISRQCYLSNSFRPGDDFMEKSNSLCGLCVLCCLCGKDFDLLRNTNLKFPHFLQKFSPGFLPNSDQRLSAQISGKKGFGFDILRVSVPPWWVLLLFVAPLRSLASVLLVYANFSLCDCFSIRVHSWLKWFLIRVHQRQQEFCGSLLPESAQLSAKPRQ